MSGLDLIKLSFLVSPHFILKYEFNYDPLLFLLRKTHKLLANYLVLLQFLFTTMLLKHNYYINIDPDIPKSSYLFFPW